MAVEQVGTREIQISSLTYFPGNARRGNTAEIRKSVRRLGQYRSVVVRDTGSELVILAGNHTVRAMAEEGLESAHCGVIRCTDDEARRVAIADNRLAELGGYDDDALVELLSYLDDDYEGTGWTEEDVSALIDGSGEPEPTGGGDPDATPEPPAIPVTQPGDIWLLGPHRIICGDCRDFGTVEKLLAGERVNVAFTSPPYASQRAYDESSGFKPIPPDEYVDWFEDVQSGVRAVLADDGSWFVNIKASADGLDTYLYVMDLVVAHVRRWGWHYATEFCWKRPGVPKSVSKRFKNEFEPVYQFAVGPWKMRPDAVRHVTDNARVPLGPGAGDTGWADDQGNGGVLSRNRLEPGLAYPGNMLPTFTGSHEALGHTAAFPVGLPAFFIRAYSDPGDTVFDPFMGSGSSLIAAHQENRTAYGCEISPAYCDVILKRFEQHAGIKPERVLEDGTTEPVTFTT